jgi:hypothetical protein
MSTRRAFIKSGAIAVFGMSLGGVPAFVARAANAFKLDTLYKKNIQLPPAKKIIDMSIIRTML